MGMHGMARLLRYIRESLILDGITLHLNHVAIPYKAIQQFVVLVKLNHLETLKELCVDVECFGILGIASLIGAMSQNISLERLFIDLTGGVATVHIFGPLLVRMAPNSYLREFHLVGAPLDAPSVRGLCHSCKVGLSSLSYLKICVSPDARAEAEDLVEVCKNRTRVGRGVSLLIED